MTATPAPPYVWYVDDPLKNVHLQNTPKERPPVQDELSVGVEQFVMIALPPHWAEQDSNKESMTEAQLLMRSK